MGRERKKSDVISIVEACYRPADAQQEWLAHLLELAQPVLDQGGGLGLSLVKEGSVGRSIVLSDGVGPLRDMLRLSWPIIEQLDELTYRGFYYPGVPVVRASSLVSRFAPPARAAFSSLMQHAGASDLLGMLGYPAGGWAFALFLAIGKTPISPQLQRTLRRLRIHVEASFRLRVLPPTSAVAIIHPDGRVVHAEGDALERPVRARLRVQAAAIERARSPRQREDPHRALAVWRALVDGRWSVVERTDPDGQRFYYAFENAPEMQLQRGLTPTESSVLRAALRGRSDGDIAYEIGRSRSRVSNVLAAAAERLGFSGRQDMLRIAARLRGHLHGRAPQSLSAGERAILALARRGLTNGAMAEARGVSTHTVAAQLRSLRRKLGGVSRRGMLLLDL